jgi:hypothetical protein
MLAWIVALAFLTLAGGLSPVRSAIAMLILGFTGAVGNIEFGTYLVANIGDGMIARVTSIGQMLTIGSAALGSVLGGAAFQECGAQQAIEILLSLVVILLACCCFILPEITQPIHAPSSITRSFRKAKPRATVALEILGRTLVRTEQALTALRSDRMRWPFPYGGDWLGISAPAGIFRRDSPDSFDHEIVDHCRQDNKMP